MTARTIFYRFNVNTSNYEYAGEIDWGLHQSMVTFGTAEPRSIREMRQAKTPGKSQSRRFTWNGHQYKWKRGEAQNDLQCFTVPMLGAGKLVASFEGSSQTLTVEARAREDVIDQIVVLCVVHLFLISAGKW
ncbi:hypothetical protein EXIGLDRAFT_690625 [Exidia glandulosa HHB12029]|uniref:DUF6593 domain-containing protein n=1 Tax=Exidia glandulosa HHB12029 TaxID=1314781 RepID=A0A165QNY0_EXIGL|nr:hypothetical protein EXIGLDRAFT_690625 [Exidia glandulosa HHB12029]